MLKNWLETELFFKTAKEMKEKINFNKANIEIVRRFCDGAFFLMVNHPHYIYKDYEPIGVILNDTY